jgi:hypothetical protein
MDILDWKNASMFEKISIILSIIVNVLLILVSMNALMFGWIPLLIINMIFMFIDWDIYYFLSKIIKIDK